MGEWIALHDFCVANGLGPSDVKAILEKYLADKAAGKV